MSHSNLIRQALHYAQLDRQWFLTAIENSGDTSLIEETKAKLTHYAQLANSPGRLKPKGQTIFTALVEAQSYIESLIDAYAGQPSTTRQQRSCKRLASRLRILRLTNFGPTTLETITNGPKTTMVSVLKLPHKNPDHPGGITARTVLDHQTLPQTQSPE